MNFLNSISIILLSIACIGLGRRINKLSSRINNLEQTIEMRDWLKAVNDGESLSDLAYMQQKGFLK